MTRLRIDRTLSAPVERVWQALTDPDALAAWFWPAGFGTTVRADARPGGRFRIEAAGSPAGALAVEGEYAVVDRPHRLVFTWRWQGDDEETLVTVELSELDGGTGLLLTHERFPDDATRDNHLTGWTDCLDRLPSWLALTAIAPPPRDAAAASRLDDPLDPPAAWARDHLHRYVASDGRTGHLWRGVHTLLLTTVGRRSGRGRRTPLIYGRDDDRFVVVASKGGGDAHPLWYGNLVADPTVRVQVGADRFDAYARAAKGDERSRLWALMTGIWPDYDAYQARTKREIPVVVLERLADTDGGRR